MAENTTGGVSVNVTLDATSESAFNKAAKALTEAISEAVEAAGSKTVEVVDAVVVVDRQVTLVESSAPEPVEAEDEDEDEDDFDEEDDDEDDEDFDEDDDDDDEDDEYLTAADLKKMDKAELRAVAKEMGLKPGPRTSEKTLRTMILEAAEEDDDE